MARIEHHPILPVLERNTIQFTFEGKAYTGLEGDMISSALFANGITVFGTHERDSAAKGIYCANGQCSECMVIADGSPVKACMTELSEGMDIQQCRGYPPLPDDGSSPRTGDIECMKTPVLVIGGGPAGMSAALELAKHGVHVVLADDKTMLGGKLTLQTHNFFGSCADCWAGKRGTDIAEILEKEIETHGPDMIDVWLRSSAVGVFSDRKVGIVRNGEYVLVEPDLLLIATGAREKALAFQGCSLPGVFGAGAFQTLVNRDLVRASENLFICGGGNVGLISAYHALQAGINVKGLVEALPECGGYRVHLDKIRRLGVPVYTSHTVLRADGGTQLESVTICEVDSGFKPVSGTEKTFDVDTLLIAVGLSPVDELYTQARKYGMNVFAAGDAETIAEASAAMMNGRIRGREMAQQAGKEPLIPGEWEGLTETLRSKPVQRDIPVPDPQGDIYPVIRCSQDIPCNPCVEACPVRNITLENGELTGRAQFSGDMCLGCAQCVLACPGLAITLVDERYDPSGKRALVTMPFEFEQDTVAAGDRVTTVDFEGNDLGTGTVVAFRNADSQNRRLLILVETPFEDRLHAAGIRLFSRDSGTEGEVSCDDSSTIICRCERVTKGEVLSLIRAGYRDMNQIKAALRAGMGACGGKTCRDLILRLFREEGIDPDEVTLPVERPPLSEVPLGVFAGRDRT